MLAQNFMPKIKGFIKAQHFYRLYGKKHNFEGIFFALNKNFLQTNTKGTTSF